MEKMEIQGLDGLSSDFLEDELKEHNIDFDTYRSDYDGFYDTVIYYNVSQLRTINNILKEV